MKTIKIDKPLARLAERVREGKSRRERERRILGMMPRNNHLKIIGRLFGNKWKNRFLLKNLLTKLDSKNS